MAVLDRLHPLAAASLAVLALAAPLRAVPRGEPRAVAVRPALAPRGAAAPHRGLVRPVPAGSVRAGLRRALTRRPPCRVGSSAVRYAFHSMPACRALDGRTGDGTRRERNDGSAEPSDGRPGHAGGRFVVLLGLFAQRSC